MSKKEENTIIVICMFSLFSLMLILFPVLSQLLEKDFAKTIIMIVCLNSLWGMIFSILMILKNNFMSRSDKIITLIVGTVTGFIFYSIVLFYGFKGY